MTKVTYTEIALELRETSKVCMETKGSYSYVCGTYESIIADVVADLPKHKQAEVMRLLAKTRERLTSDA
jgi:hypothetical protein